MHSKKAISSGTSSAEILRFFDRVASDKKMHEVTLKFNFYSLNSDQNLKK